jgi:molecular chaperone Hsp33
MSLDLENIPENDFILPFQLEKSQIRGRLVDISNALDEIITMHNYPKPINHLVAESVTLSLALSSMLKYEGFFTLQAQGDGPVAMIVSDVRSPAFIRSCAHFDVERVTLAREQLDAMKSPETSQNHLAQFLGKGLLAFTVDRKGQAERYQGIVELDGASLTDCVQNYFKQSEQIGTGIHMAVGQRDNGWRARAIMLQHMPEDGKNPQAGMGNIMEDEWRHAMIMMQSATVDELLDPVLSAQDLLYRLFHEDGIRVYEPQIIERDCRCTVEKIQNVVRMLPEEDRKDIVKDGRIEMTCEFCSKTFCLDPKNLDIIDK